jgi:hypothetical protein
MLLSDMLSAVVVILARCAGRHPGSSVDSSDGAVTISKMDLSSVLEEPARPIIVTSEECGYKFVRVCRMSVFGFLLLAWRLFLWFAMFFSHSEWGR